jgi:hypothetical protein
MKTYARIESGVIAELIAELLDSDGKEISIADRFHPDIAATIVDASTAAGVEPGWTYVDRVFRAPTAPEPAAPPVPSSISPAQARIALHNADLLDQVEAAVASAGIVTQIAWAQATAIERDSPTVAALSAALGLSDGQLDDLFTAGAAIRV